MQGYDLGGIDRRQFVQSRTQLIQIYIRLNLLLISLQAGDHRSNCFLIQSLLVARGLGCWSLFFHRRNSSQSLMVAVISLINIV